MAQPTGSRSPRFCSSWLSAQANLQRTNLTARGTHSFSSDLPAPLPPLCHADSARFVKECCSSLKHPRQPILKALTFRGVPSAIHIVKNRIAIFLAGRFIGTLTKPTWTAARTKDPSTFGIVVWQKPTPRCKKNF